jgi:Arc/MetJ family transcription regulator
MAIPSAAKRVTCNADAELLAQAQEALGTATTTDTINTALAEIVRRTRVEALLAHDFSNLSPEMLAEMQRPRIPGQTTEWVAPRGSLG